MSNTDSSSEKPQSLFAISSSRVVTPDGERASAVVIAGETIRDVIPADELPSGIPVLDFGNLVISPGIVDAHVHINEPGRTEWEGFVTATSAAAAGGITSLIDMPLNSSPVTTSVDALRAKQNAAFANCYVDVGFYGGLVPGNRDQLLPLVDAGVIGIKAFMCDSGLDEFPAASESDLREALEVLKDTGVPLLVHAELADTDSIPGIQGTRSYREYERSRPPEFELAAIELLIRLCREFKTPIHIVHLATARALTMIEEAKTEGLPLTVETCPHYLFFSNQEIEDGQTCYKCAPPIRSDANRTALCEAVASGLIETVGSDHSPCLPELKLPETGDFSNAWGGIAGLQLTLPVMWTVGKPVGWTPWLLAERLSHRPAEVFSVTRKGRVESGFDADLVVWDPDQAFVVQGKNLFHRHAVTPYEGRELFGVVQHTFVRGRQVYGFGQLKDACGKPLTRAGFAERSISNHLNSLSTQQLAAELESCCASQSWIARMVRDGRFRNNADVENRAEQAWLGMMETDYLEAFSAHSRIGNIDTLREKFANTNKMASREQAGVESADESTLMRLDQANNEYFDKFGFIFIVCATGKSAAEMLDILESRLPNDRETELENAAVEQLKITLIRLRNLIG
jgi:allantoinase